MKNEIKISRYIIHFLEKDQRSKVTRLDLSKKVSKSDEFSKTLVEEIHNSINLSSSLKNTKYRENNTNDFTTFLDNYFEISDDNEFFKFSESIKVLDEKLKNEFLALGGYYLFIDYEVSGKRFISVVLLRKKSGINITKVGDIYKLNSSENLNIEKIAMAFRLNFEIYSSEDDRNYLALITTQQDGNISEYFKDWVNAGDLIKSSANTANLIKIIKTIDRPKDENGNDIYNSLGDFQKAIYDYSNVSKVINIFDLSRNLYGENESNKISNYAKECNFIIDPEFKKDTAKWKGLITIKASVAGIELNVDYNKVNDDEVKVLEDSIIIYSKELADKIKAQHLEEKTKNEKS